MKKIMFLLVLLFIVSACKKDESEVINKVESVNKPKTDTVKQTIKKDSVKQIKIDTINNYSYSYSMTVKQLMDEFKELVPRTIEQVRDGITDSTNRFDKKYKGKRIKITGIADFKFTDESSHRISLYNPIFGRTGCCYSWYEPDFELLPSEKEKFDKVQITETVGIDSRVKTEGQKISIIGTIGETHEYDQAPKFKDCVIFTK